MRKNLVEQKRRELKALPGQELVDRIMEYPDQDSLNFYGDGKKRMLPIGEMASQIASQNYRMTNRQRFSLIHHFGDISIEDRKVVGVSFRENRSAEFEMQKVLSENTKTSYDVMFTLRPEPENPYDENAVMVLAPLKDGTAHHVGYLSKDFVAAHSLKTEVQMAGTVTDFSNGKFKNVSYAVHADLELMHKHSAMPVQNDVRFYDYEFEYSHSRASDLKPVSDFKAASRIANENDWAKLLNDVFVRAEHCNCRASHAESAEFEFLENGRGVLHVALTGPTGTNPPDYEVVARSLHEAGYVKEQAYSYGGRPYTEYRTPYDMLEQRFKDIGMSLRLNGLAYTIRTVPKNAAAEESMETVDGLVHMRSYERKFQINGNVMDPGAAAACIREMGLSESLDADFVKYGVPCHVERMEWEFNAPENGKTMGAIRMEVSGTDFDGPTVSMAAVANSFAAYMQEEVLGPRLREEGLVDTPYTMNVFNKKPFGGFLRQAAQPEAQNAAPKEARGDLSLTESDLSFARQMELSDFGIC